MKSSSDLVNFHHFCCCMHFWTYLNYLTPKGDEYVISPYNITYESYIKIIRIKEMITK